MTECPQPRQARSAARLAAVQALYQHADGGHRSSRGCSTNSTSTASAPRSRTTSTPRPKSISSTTWSQGALARARRDRRAARARKLAEGWTLARLDKTMLQILRAGAYELLARPDVPVGTAISEYVDVAHAFFDDARGEVRQRRARRGGEGRALSGEAAFIEALRALATHPAARGLADDARCSKSAARRWS